MSIFASILSRPEFRSLKVSLPLGQWVCVAHERHRLSQLDERMLRDIGVDEASAAQEASRPFWDVPARRRCRC